MAEQEQLVCEAYKAVGALGEDSDTAKLEALLASHPAVVGWSCASGSDLTPIGLAATLGDSKLDTLKILLGAGGCGGDSVGNTQTGKTSLAIAASAQAEGPESHHTATLQLLTAADQGKIKKLEQELAKLKTSSAVNGAFGHVCHGDAHSGAEASATLPAHSRVVPCVRLLAFYDCN